MDAQTSALQNSVIATNSIARAITYVMGQITSLTYTGPQVIQLLSGPGRVVNVCLVTTGSGEVKLYDSSTINSPNANGLLYILPSTAQAGITQLGLECSDGIVVDIGSDCVVNVTYSAAGG